MRTRIAGKREEWVKLPLERLYLEYTNRCNMSCTFCPYSCQKRPKGRLKFELMKRVVHEITEKRIADLIEVTGYGEPLLNPQWYQISQYIIRCGIRLNITTNGALLTEPVSERLASLECEDIIISLQTPDRESFKLRKARIDFDTYIGRLKQFIAIHARLRSRSHIRLRFLNTVGTKQMSFPEPVSVLNSSGEMIARLKEWSKIVCDMIAIPYEEHEVDRKLAGIPRVRPAMVHVNNTVTLESKLCNDYWVFGTGRPLRFPTRFARCRAMTLQNVLIYYDGQVSLCCADFDNYLNLGSLSDASLTEVLHSEKAAALVEGFRRFRVRSQYCQHCLGGNGLVLATTKAIAASLYQLHVKEFAEFDLRGAETAA